MNKNVVKTDKAPQAIGPYSQAIEVNGMVYTSGVVPIDPATGNVVEGDIKVQATRVFDSMKALLEAAGSSCEDVVKTTVFIKDMNDFAALNEIYATSQRRTYRDGSDRTEEIITIGENIWV